MKSEENKKENDDLQRKIVVFLVGAEGFEPSASWTRTMRDTKLRHAPIKSQLIYYMNFPGKCQVVYRAFRLKK